MKKCTKEMRLGFDLKRKCKVKRHFFKQNEASRFFTQSDAFPKNNN